MFIPALLGAGLLLLLRGNLLKRQALAPGQRVLHRLERLTVAAGTSRMHGARQPGDAFVPDIAADRLGDHFDTLDCTLLATGLDSGDLCVERAGIRAETRIIRLPADRLMRLGRDIAVGEELGGIIRALGLVAHDLAGMQLDDALAHRVDDLLVVRGHHDRRAGAVDGVQHLHDAQRRRRIEVSGGLIGQQDLRMVHIRAGDGHTLLLTAGQLMRVVVLLTGQSHGLQHLRHQRLDGGPARADHLKRERHILPHGLVRQQLVILEHESDGTTILRHLTVRQTAKIIAGHSNLAVRGLLLAQQQAQQRRLAGTGSTDQKHEIATFDVEVDIIQRRPRTLGIHLAHMIQCDECHIVSSLAPGAGSQVTVYSSSSAAWRRCS